MKWPWLAVVVSLLLAALVFAQAPADQALAVYEQGKVLYDAKDFGGALAKFDEAIALEPTKARWHYNRGLALKKLKRDSDAIAALLESRRLDPEYKRPEIDQKLSELGYAPPSTSADGPTPTPVSSRSTPAVSMPNEPGDWFAVVIGLLIAGFGCFSVVGVLYKLVRALTGSSRTAPGAAAQPSMRAQRTDNTPEALQKADGALREGAAALGQVEHGLSLGEDAEVRRAADRAATNLQTARKALEAARRNERPVGEVHQALDRARAATKEGLDRVLTLHGERVLSTVGPRAGCFFCARALPTPGAGEAVQLRSSSGVVTVAACRTCARRVGTGTPPPVLMVDADQRRHWAELDEFNPYVHAHAPPPNTVEVNAWNVMNAGAGLSPLATIAGGAVLGALGAVAAGRIINLDNLKQSALASAAAAASAHSATKRRSTEYSDHS
ncbi:MAG: tetratricopeptide repeat protein [Myxococcaceae bacterium]|nr:tetratricopeptide repeat protein [Myxococcaceae bacterium]